MSRLLGFRRIALVVVVGLALTACESKAGTSTNPPSPKPTTPSVKPLAYPWKGADVCPIVDRGLTEKGMHWAVAPDNKTGQTCIMVGQSASEQNADAFVNLDGGNGTCSKKTPPAGITAEQVTGLGSTACVVSGHPLKPSAAGSFVEIGVGFSDNHAVGISCESPSPAVLTALRSTCRAVGDAVVAALKEH